jgi:hypothetical protein
MKPHNPWTPEETARFLASASARQAQLEARVQLLAKALRRVELACKEYWDVHSWHAYDADRLSEELQAACSALKEVEA